MTPMQIRLLALAIIAVVIYGITVHCTEEYRYCPRADRFITFPLYRRMWCALVPYAQVVGVIAAIAIVIIAVVTVAVMLIDGTFPWHVLPSFWEDV